MIRILEIIKCQIKIMGYCFSLFFTLLLYIILTVPAQALGSTSSSFWLDIKPKIVQHLQKSIDSSKYKYQLLGPNRDMDHFLGNRPSSPLSFSAINLSNPASEKTLLVHAGKDHIGVLIKVWEYKDLWVINKAVTKGSEVYAKDLSKQRIPILQRDERLYYQGSPLNKVATQNLPAGTALKMNMLRHEKMVQSGDIVEVISESAFIKLAFHCHSFSSGDPGDTINLSCPDMSKRTAQGVIQEDGRIFLR